MDKTTHTDMRKASEEAFATGHSELAKQCEAMTRESMELSDQLRCESLENLRVLETPINPTLDELLELLVETTQFEGAMLTFIGKDDAFIKGFIHRGQRAAGIIQRPRSAVICNTAMEKTDDVLVVPNAKIDEKFSEFPIVKECDVTTYVGKAVLSSDGVPLGAVCLIDSAVREVTPKETSILAKFAKIVSLLIEKNIV